MTKRERKSCGTLGALHLHLSYGCFIQQGADLLRKIYNTLQCNTISAQKHPAQYRRAKDTLVNITIQ